MTDREVVDVSETKLRILRRAGNQCEACGNPIGPHNTQLAHRIPQTDGNIKKYGKSVVHHDLNLAATCSLVCNGKVVVHGVAEERLVQRIREDLSQGNLFANDVFAPGRMDGLW